MRRVGGALDVIAPEMLSFVMHVIIHKHYFQRSCSLDIALKTAHATSTLVETMYCGDVLMSSLNNL